MVWPISTALHKPLYTNPREVNVMRELHSELVFASTYMYVHVDLDLPVLPAHCYVVD